MKSTTVLKSTDCALLGMLSLEPMSGYQMRKEIDESIAHFWSESYGQIYPALARLVAQKLIAPVGKKGRVDSRGALYSLTALGKSELMRWLNQTPEVQVPRNQLLLKLFFGRAVPTQVSVNHLREFRERVSKSLIKYQLLRERLSAERKAHPDLPFWLITLRHGELLAQTHVQWCDEAIASLDHGRGGTAVSGRRPRLKGSQ